MQTDDGVSGGSDGRPFRTAEAGLRRPVEVLLLVFMEPGEGPVVLRLSCLWGS